MKTTGFLCVNVTRQDYDIGLFTVLATTNILGLVYFNIVTPFVRCQVVDSSLADISLPFMMLKKPRGGS